MRESKPAWISTRATKRAASDPLVEMAQRELTRKSSREDTGKQNGITRLDSCEPFFFSRNKGSRTSRTCGAATLGNGFPKVYHEPITRLCRTCGDFSDLKELKL